MRVCSLVITFQPSKEVCAHLRAVAGQADRLYVVDNGSDDEGIAVVTRATSDVGGVLIRLQANVGVAAALNIGIAAAREDGFEWVATFDQDSVPGEGYVRRLVSCASTHPSSSAVAVIGGNPVDASTGRSPYDGSVGDEAVPTLTLITSGSVVNLSVMSRLGPFREDLFIDGVDQEYCLRAIGKGYSVLSLPTATFTHSVGHASACRVLGRLLVPTHHSPVRRYYMTRNTLVLACEYAVEHPGWACRRLWTLVKMTAVILMCESQKRTKLVHIGMGVRDAAAGRMGVFELGARNAAVPATEEERRR